MTMSAANLLETIRRELAPADDENRLVPLIAEGQAPLAVLAALAAEQHHIITSDRRSFLTIAARSSDAASIDFFTGLAEGESLALAKLPAFAAAAGMDDAGLRLYEPQPGCQAYPAYVAWLALNADPAEAVLALLANFAAWGSYCATVSQALRKHYGFGDDSCAFFDFFAAPAPELEEQALAVVQVGLDAGAPLLHARRYGRLLQGYEVMFWNTLAEAAAVGA
jgi:hypothetical protein